MGVFAIVKEFLNDSVFMVVVWLFIGTFILVAMEGKRSRKEEEEEERVVSAVEERRTMTMKHPIGGLDGSDSEKRVRFVEKVENIGTGGDIQHGFGLNKDPQASRDELIRMNKECHEKIRIDKERSEGIVMDHRRRGLFRLEKVENIGVGGQIQHGFGFNKDPQASRDELIRINEEYHEKNRIDKERSEGIVMDHRRRGLLRLEKVENIGVGGQIQHGFGFNKDPQASRDELIRDELIRINEEYHEKNRIDTERSEGIVMDHRRRGLLRLEKVENIGVGGQIQHGFGFNKDPQASRDELIRINEECHEKNRIDKERSEGIVMDHRRRGLLRLEKVENIGVGGQIQHGFGFSKDPQASRDELIRINEECHEKNRIDKERSEGIVMDHRRRGLLRLAEKVENIGVEEVIQHGFGLKKDTQASRDELIRMNKECHEKIRIDKEGSEGIVMEQVVGGSMSGVEIQHGFGLNKDRRNELSRINKECFEKIRNLGLKNIQHGLNKDRRNELIRMNKECHEKNRIYKEHSQGIVMEQVVGLEVQVVEEEVIESVGSNSELAEVSEIGVNGEVEDGDESNNAGIEKELVEGVHGEVEDGDESSNAGIEKELVEGVHGEVEDGDESSNAGIEKELVEGLEIGGKGEAKDEEGSEYARIVEELVENLRVVEAKKEDEIGNIGLESSEESVNFYGKEEEEVNSDQLREGGVVEGNWNEVPETKMEVEVREEREMVEKNVRVEFAEEHQVNEREEECNEIIVASDDDDDWEGVERTEIEKHFGAAAAFVGSSENSDVSSKLSSDVQMQLYGLHKVAMEGPCREQAPLALMMSARAKWNSWQQLGNMSPEVAMEQYVDLLSDGIPGWAGENSEGDHKKDGANDSSEAGKSITIADESSVLHQQIDSEK